MVWDPWGAADVHSLHDPAVLADAVDAPPEPPARPALATVQIADGLVVDVYRHVSDLVPESWLPARWTGEPGDMTIHPPPCVDDDPVRLTGGVEYPAREADPDGVRWIRHTAPDLKLAIDRHAVSVPVLTGDELELRTAVGVCAALGLCVDLPIYIREREAQIDGAAMRRGASSIREYLRTTARRAQVDWLRARIGPGEDPALALVRRVAYGERPPRVVSAYAAALLLAAWRNNPERTNEVIGG